MASIMLCHQPILGFLLVQSRVALRQPPPCRGCALVRAEQRERVGVKLQADGHGITAHLQLSAS